MAPGISHNFYKTLGIGQRASHDEIKKTAKKLLIRHHPDRHSTAANRLDHERFCQFVMEARDGLLSWSVRSLLDEMIDRGDEFEDVQAPQILSDQQSDQQDQGKPGTDPTNNTGTGSKRPMESEDEAEGSSKRTKYQEKEPKGKGRADEDHISISSVSSKETVLEPGDDSDNDADLKPTVDKIEDGIPFAEWKKDNPESRRLVYGSFDRNWKFLRRAGRKDIRGNIVHARTTYRGTNIKYADCRLLKGWERLTSEENERRVFEKLKKKKKIALECFEDLLILREESRQGKRRGGRKRRSTSRPKA